MSVCFTASPLEHNSRRPVVNDPILMDLLQSCGPALICHTQKERHQLLDTVWQELRNAGTTAVTVSWC